MQSLISLPHTRVFVRKQFLQQESQPDGVIEAYLVGVCCVLNEAPKLMVMTYEGAMFCYVPPNAICFTEDAWLRSLGDVCAWDCLADRGEIVQLDFLRHYAVKWTNRRQEQLEGTYMWTLHFDPTQAWGRLPEQLKLFHFVRGDDHNLHIIVNNQTRWSSDFFDRGDLEFRPESNMKVWFSEE